MRVLVVLLLLLVLPAGAEELYFPYREAGLTRQEAAAHLLGRFAFGPRPGEVDRVAKQGLEKWFARQLEGGLPSPELDRLLAQVPDDSSEWNLRERKLLRGILSENQLHEVLTDFWFNHFNVSLTDGDCAQYVADFERSAIRPNLLKSFRTMLGATARHPCMLYYLDNAYSEARGTGSAEVESGKDPLGYGPARRPARKPVVVASDPSGRRGLNENYARELMELHTLGVDGGYKQKDVTEVARIFTGWTVTNRQFTFDEARHDQSAKKVMGRPFQPEGVKEGERVLDMLAGHTSTARFVSHKLAVRFVSDNPPRSLTTRLERVFMRSQGDLRKVLVALVESPEFWQSRRAKVKSPFELTVSAVRILGARLEGRSNLGFFCEQMGQELYSCRPPTGYPDRADYWINTGNLLNRMNFGLKLAAGEIRGIKPQLETLRSGRPPRTPQEALKLYAAALLPGRDVKEAVEKLTPLALDPDFARKVESMAAGATPAKSYPQATPKPRGRVEMTPRTLAHVTGILLGSPEFQRR